MTVVILEVVDMTAVIKEYLAIHCCLICSGLLVMAMVGCQPAETDRIASLRLPDHATNVEYVGHGWYTLEITEGSATGCYLYKTIFNGGSITTIPCE